jgi:hypothetical protein
VDGGKRSIKLLVEPIWMIEEGERRLKTDMPLPHRMEPQLRKLAAKAPSADALAFRPWVSRNSGDKAAIGSY